MYKFLNNVYLINFRFVKASLSVFRHLDGCPNWKFEYVQASKRQIQGQIKQLLLFRSGVKQNAPFAALLITIQTMTKPLRCCYIYICTLVVCTFSFLVLTFGLDT